MEGEAAVSEGGLYFGRDQIGSVRRNFKTATEAPAVDYDPYGVKLQGSTTGNDFGFAAMFAGDPAGNYLTWFRSYDPNLGVWLSRDIIGEQLEDLSLYSFPRQEPSEFRRSPWALPGST